MASSERASWCSAWLKTQWLFELLGEECTWHRAATWRCDYSGAGQSLCRLAISSRSLASSCTLAIHCCWRRKLQGGNIASVVQRRWILFIKCQLKVDVAEMLLRKALLVWLFGLGGCSVGQFRAGCVWYAGDVGQESSAGRGGCCSPRGTEPVQRGRVRPATALRDWPAPTWMQGTRALLKDLHLTICVIFLANFLYLTSYFAAIF